MKRKDCLEILRYTFAGVFILTIIRKIFLPEFELNFRKFFTSLTPMLDYQIETIWFGLIVLEVFIIIGVFYRGIFQYSFFPGFILLSIGIVLSIISMVLQIQSNCGCGLLGKNPYLVLFQKLALMTILVILSKNRKLLFAQDSNS